MKKIKILGIILFVLTIISPIIAFTISSVVGELAIFEIAGIVRYTWIMWLFVPIPICSIIVGCILKNNNQKYLKNIIVAIICIPILFIFGSFRFIFKNTSYDTSRVTLVEEQINLDLPNSVKIATIDYTDYYVSYVKITNENSVKEFEQEIEHNALWKETLSTNIKELLPFVIAHKMESFDMFVFYNLTSLKYNEFPSFGKNKCIFIAYDYELKRLIIIDNFIVDIL